MYSFSNRCDEDPGIELQDDAYKIVINTKGSVGEISKELKAVIKYLDTGVADSEYTKELAQEVEFVKSDEKWRREYMLMMEAYAIQRDLGEHKKVVRSIRRKRNKRSISDIIDVLEISEDEYQSVISALDSHPDWDDEKIAEEINWTT